MCCLLRSSHLLSVSIPSNSPRICTDWILRVDCSMATNFQKNFPDVAANSTSQGWLTSILQLGGWAGALSAGILCEIFSRKHTILGGALWVILGSYLTAGAHSSSYLYSGRFFTGIGVGTLSAVGCVLSFPHHANIVILITCYSTVPSITPSLRHPRFVDS